jgi:hypothetical protein
MDYSVALVISGYHSRRKKNIFLDTTPNRLMLFENKILLTPSLSRKVYRPLNEIELFALGQVIYIYIYIYIPRLLEEPSLVTIFKVFILYFAATCFGPCWPSSSGIHKPMLTKYINFQTTLVNCSQNMKRYREQVTIPRQDIKILTNPTRKPEKNN